MLSHIIKMVWNRKRANLLIVIEIAMIFMVLFGLISSAYSSYRDFSKPLGFEWKNTWAISIGTGGRWKNETDAAPFKALFETLQQQKGIESVSMSSVPIFEYSGWSSESKYNGKEIYYGMNYVNETGPQDWGVKLIAGRWFGEQDNGQNYREVMVNRLFVETMFDEEQDGLKKAIGFDLVDDEEPTAKPMRIVGVFEAFRQQGHFSSDKPYLFFRYRLDKGYGHGSRNIYLKFENEKSVDYEDTLVKLLKSIAPNWEFTIRTWKSMRAGQIAETVVPMKIVGIIVGFLLLMVAMGLFGVLWQNINRRTREIGLRRAIGASAVSIQLQVVSEMVVLAGLAVLFSLFILIQIPLLELIDTVTWNNFWMSFVIAISVVLVMVVLCSLYPSRTAIALSPANALHYE